MCMVGLAANALGDKGPPNFRIDPNTRIATPQTERAFSFRNPQATTLEAKETIYNQEARQTFARTGVIPPPSPFLQSLGIKQATEESLKQRVVDATQAREARVTREAARALRPPKPSLAQQQAFNLNPFKNVARQGTTQSSKIPLAVQQARNKAPRRVGQGGFGRTATRRTFLSR